MRTRMWRDRSIAWGIVLAWHAWAGWLLLRPPMLESHVAVEALQVVYIQAAPAAIPVVTAPPRRRPTHAGESRRAPQPPPAANATRIAPADTTTTARAQPAPPPAALSVVVLEQIRVQARQQAPIDFATRDPLARRPKQLPRSADGRIRMAPGLSPETLVARVGGYLFAPRGYDADPCPRNRENIGNLSAAQDPRALQQELEFERRHCRP